MGAHNVRQSESSQVEMTSFDFDTHSGWNPETLKNDVAWIRLPEKVTLSKYKYFMQIKVFIYKIFDILKIPTFEPLLCQVDQIHLLGIWWKLLAGASHQIVLDQSVMFFGKLLFQ